MQLDKKKKY